MKKRTEEKKACKTNSISISISTADSRPKKSSLSVNLKVTRMTTIYRNPQIVSMYKCTVTSLYNLKRLTKWTGDNLAK